MPRIFTSLLHSVANRRTALSDTKLLERELSEFTNPDDLLELESMFRRYPDEQTQQMRSILGHQAMHQI